MVKNKIYQEREIKSKAALWERFQAVYEEVLTPEVCRDLISSMPRRIQAVIDANGGYTKY
ncbi:hypothetical protein CAOG_08781 [Capsaspora owczarzaki ATCC 30864]|nr:hypothetical protein CAOG_08781 [Capsaspora owczarzaki ATCC 30864]|eukprot:XP_011270411.1 hypothetical protein CAOG_08781 [Capsaspora owczarzaki ATCC 30864]